MRLPPTVSLMLVIVATQLAAQGSHGAPATPATTGTRQTPSANSLATLTPLKLEDQWTRAVINRDTGTFEQLLAPNFVYTENAIVMSRRDVIGSVTGPDQVQWARNEGMRLHDFGDVHVITGVLHLRGRSRNGSFDRRYQFTDTWQRRNGRWQIIAAQDYLIPK
jgi:ketosteroid isomerase-like protein